jgi:plasmid stabilization system protein ParE
VTLVKLLDEARDEVLDAAAWYEGQQSGVGTELIQELADTLQAIEDRPDRFPFLENSRSSRQRRALLQRFPYMVVYDVVGEEVVVAAFAHTARRPNYWQHRRKSQ